jgi:hypothetical protein
MKNIIITIVACWFFFGSITYSAEAIPDWVYKSCQKQGDVWLFSGSVHDISILNVAIPLARNAALSNLASNIGITANANVSHKVEGSEVDGYTQSISIDHGYLLDRVVVYGVRQKKVYFERYQDPYSGRLKFNVYVLLEVSDSDLGKAKDDFSKHVYTRPNPAPMYKSKEEPGFITRLIRKVGL